MIEKVLCKCGCGQPTPLFRTTRRERGQFRGDPQKWIPGHSGAKTRVITTADYAVEDRGYETPCWIWTRAPGSKLGYGKVIVNNEHIWAHTAMWEQTHGRLVPDGLELDHLCRIPSCIRPEHLEPVTHQENLHRGRSTRMTPDKLRRIHELRRTGMTLQAIADAVGLGHTTVGDVLQGKRWNHDPGGGSPTGCA